MASVCGPDIASRLSFYSDGFGIPAAAAGALLLMARIFDAYPKKVT
jgi:hypothetical protein